MFGDRHATTFDHSIEGTWGTFHTPAGRVAFIVTKGRLGPTSTDPLWRLTQQLSPVREVLGIKDMDFNQLLQRDLDDHRIATDLIPYLLEPEHTGPAFFPPIIAIVLPFSGKQPASQLPPSTALPPHKDNEMAANVAGYEHGDMFRFVKAVTDDGRDHPANYGRLSWNKERAKLVVIDGQHRAMAMIAINRTANDDWRQSTGEKYETFYSERVSTLLHAAIERGSPVDLSKVEYPVTICWLPDSTSPERNPHEAARKLFVDINKNAKPPSDARLILLSDTQLSNVFTRELLNRIRTPGHNLPLYSIEYDNPDSDATRPARWSVLTNLDMLKNGVLKLAFGPKRIFTDMSASFGGKPNWTDMNWFMRDRLTVTDVYPEEIVDGPRRIRRSSLSNRLFPVYDHSEKQRILDRFIEVAGDGMLYILAEVHHYKQHVTALKGIYEGWNTAGNNVGQLAKDALFEGMGMYWTLRDGHIHYEYRCQEAREQRQPTPTQPDVSKAWTILTTDKKADFVKERCRFLLEKNTPPTSEQIKASDDLYQSMNTQACQVGAFLTWGTVATIPSKCSSSEICIAVVEAWNAAFRSRRSGLHDRRFIFSRNVDKPLNTIRNLDTPYAIHYRYFWLELLCISEAKAVLQEKGIDTNRIGELRDSARKNYLSFLIKEQQKAVSVSRPSLTP